MEGILLNLPSLEAEEELRRMMSFGAMLAGEQGKEYIEFLQASAWTDPRKVKTAKSLLDASMAKQGKPGVRNV